MIKQIKVWGFTGWIFSFILAGKDHDNNLGQCMDASFGEDISFSMSTWLWVDGGSTLFMTIVCILIYFLRDKGD